MEKRLKMSVPVSILFFCLLFLSGDLLAQNATLRGRVTDEESGEPLAGANVIVQSAEVQTGSATRVDGFYVVRNLPPGTYTVTVSYIGYERENQSNVTLSPGESRTLDFALKLTGIVANPVAVTASRRPEKILEAPADITVLEAQQIEARPTLTPAEHLKALPAVDVASTGLNQANVVVRGFNNVFSGSLLTLVDNRIARVPSLRVNAYNFIPTSNADMERYEVVLGPGSALYGPNAASGVFHMITKSPLGSEGTEVSVGGGERDLVMATARHAGSIDNRFGYKFSFQYYEGTDWKNQDPAEPDSIRKFRPTPQGPQFVTELIPNDRDFDVRKIAGEVRFDYRLNDHTSAILSAGFNQGNSIELTGIGAAQAKDWTYSYVQARFNYKNLFAQAFVNASDAGDTFILRSGQLIVDNSKLFVGQIQHTSEIGDWQRFTYGFDALLTRPDTDGTINGRNEERDNIDEFGVYLQSETDLADPLKFVGAFRVDNHSELEDPVFSPRAALVFKPTPTQNFRLTYNRAFSTPSTLNLFLDIMQAPDAFTTGRLFEPALGFSPAFDVRAQGVPQSGFNFLTGPNGFYMFRSPFAPLTQNPAFGFDDPLSPQDFIELNDPRFTNVMWAVGRQAVNSQFIPQLRQGMLDAGLSEAQVDALVGQLEGIVPAGVVGVENVTKSINPQTAEFEEDVPVDVPPIRESVTQTLEFGYKGVIGEKLGLGADVYYTKIEDFVSPLLVATPNVFLERSSLAAFLQAQFEEQLSRPENAILNAVLVGALDQNPDLGDNDGSAADELAGIYSGASRIPFGTVSPDEAFDPTAVIVTYRNFGEVDFWGFDVHFSLFLSANWTLDGNYSFVSEELFENLDGIADIALNAPQHKVGASVRYRNPAWGLDSQLRFRWVDSFPVNSGAFLGTVESYAVLDFNTKYTLPFSPNTTVTLTIQNLTDNKHREMVGAPEIGRLAILRLTQSL